MPEFQFDVNFSVDGFPSNFKGTLEDFKTLLVSRLSANIGIEDIIKGRIGGVAPSTNRGPWADGKSWKTWGTNAGGRTGYFYNTVAVGNRRFLVKVDGSVKKNRTIKLQDKPGTWGLKDDLYSPRETFVLQDASYYIINWDYSDSFFVKLTEDTKIDMGNSRHGQEIYVAVLNSSDHKVFWAGNLGFPGGVQPVQSLATLASIVGVLTAGSNLLYVANGNFIGQEKGTNLSGAGIPAGTTVVDVVDSKHVLMSVPATVTGAAVSITLAGRPVLGRIDLWVFKNVAGSIYGRKVSNYAGRATQEGSESSRISMNLPLEDTSVDPPPLLPPSFTPKPGHYNTYEGDMVVSFRANDATVSMAYTLNNTKPTLFSGTQVDGNVGSIVVGQGETVTIRVVSFDESGSRSAVRESTFVNVYDPPFDTPTTPDDAGTGVTRIDLGAGGGQAITRTETPKRGES